ncbi:uncharacterized protein LOC132203667 [Neocloeon triangulifer]|uniref:uncharacterized protein LOC132203666 n=1 Tax=Neocloeon triangulifer TaxID=2078957 RepID=UPI00286F8A06|nr:uncharacterized protein LOC132203666 [Neocloeon triangulifer]XP_059487566.1 uncharacterized protein LOC132203667 [Neocloeon triangulifer]
MSSVPPNATPARSTSPVEENGDAGARVNPAEPSCRTPTTHGGDSHPHPAERSPFKSPPMLATEDNTARTPKKSPDVLSFKSMKKLSPLKHVTPILKKYNAQRKAKSAKKHFVIARAIKNAKNSRQRLDSGSSCSDIEFGSGSSPEKQESLSPEKEFFSSEDQDDMQARSPSPVPEGDDDEPMEDVDFDAPSSPLEKDNEEELAALMRASSTVIPSLKGKSHLVKRTKHSKELEATLHILQQDDPATLEDRETFIAQAYLNKVRDELLAEGEEGERIFDKFIKALVDADEVIDTDAGIKTLYETVADLFRDRNELLDPFISFLQPGEALTCGKTMENVELANITDFLLKAEVAFSKQPQVLKTILSHLAAFSEQTDAKEEDVKSVILPLLKGNPLLTDCFLQLMPDSKPPESSMTDFEELVYEEGVEDEDESFEVINVPCDESKDLTGGDNCPCQCHSGTDDEMLKSRANHCTSCGIRFINGKIYLVSNRQLKPATLTFLNEDNHSAIKRLSVDMSHQTGTRRRRTGNSFSADNPHLKDSPPKSHSHESENDDSESYRDSDCSPPKSYKFKSRRTEITPDGKHNFSRQLSIDTSENKSSPGHDLLSPGSSSCDTVPLNNECDSREMMSPNGREDVAACDEESIDFVDVDDEESLDDEEIPEEEDQDIEIIGDDDSSQDDTEINQIMKMEDIKIEPVKVEIKEEPKSCAASPVPENREDSLVEKKPIPEVEPPLQADSQKSDEAPEDWTRDEDKVILQVIEQGGTANMIENMKHLIPRRTQDEIKERFETLMKLLAKMSSEAAGE